MKVHHLNVGTMCPVSAKLVNGRGGIFERARLVCHILLIEANAGLILVDTGLGVGDISEPKRLQRAWLRKAAPQLELAETAIAQIKAKGFQSDDVQHVLLTHLDRDHAGGIADFPKARIHVHRREYRAAVTREVKVREGRYIERQWAHRPDWAFYGIAGEQWFGFKGVRALDDREPDILIIPLPGHTPGHCGVAVRCNGNWLLHAGDSYYFHGQIETPPTDAPLALRLFQRTADTDRVERLANQERLRVLKAYHGSEITIFNSHDPQQFDPYLCS
jgi:glyoxylase-like metal-dependent hydrolase (beta-lactamase superfamily II)